MHRREALSPPPLKTQSAPPDLEVAVIAPAQIAQTTQGSVQVRVDNTLTIIPPLSQGGHSSLGGSAANGVNLSVRFVGLEPLTVQVQGSSSLQCALAGKSAVTCAGAIPAGGAAWISISVKETFDRCRDYCSPVYTDVIVDPFNTIAEITGLSV